MVTDVPKIPLPLNFFHSFTPTGLGWSGISSKPSMITWRLSLIPHDCLVWTSWWLPTWTNLLQLECVKCKPYPFSNEYHTFACFISKILHQIELVETQKDRPREGPYSMPEFEDSMPKIAALCCWLTKPIWGTNWVCLLDSGFRYMTTLPELEKKMLCGTMVFKKKGMGWPRGSDAKNVLCHMQGKDLGYQAVCKVSNTK